MTSTQFSQNILKVYYHINEIESLLTGMNLIKHLSDSDLTNLLESQKMRSKHLRKQFDKVFGDMSAEYGDKFDLLNEELEKHMKITVTD